MKKLLFLTNVAICILITSCQSQSNKTENKTVQDTLTKVNQDQQKQNVEVLPNSIDTNKKEMEMEKPSSTKTTDTNLNKEEKYKNKPDKFTAPKHGSPDQSQVDSIKKSKQKTKK